MVHGERPMLTDRSGIERGGVVMSILTLVGITAALGTLVADRTDPARPEHAGLHESWPAPSLAERLAAVDAAIARRDKARAVSEWRDAYHLALGSRRWDAMADVGDAAVRIGALAGAPEADPTGFRTEARQAYLRALFQARAQRAPEGIERIADAFAALGDRDVAVQARAIEVTR
jgi:hypothetical protein